MATDSDLLRKVQGLLAKAESSDSEHEAEAFFAKARELMLKYSIDEMTLRANLARAGRVEDPILVDYMFSTSDSNAVGLLHLLHQVCIAMGVRLVKYNNHRNGNLHRPGNGTYVASQWAAMVGFAGDIEAAKAMYLSLLIQDHRLANIAWRETGLTKGKSKFRTGHLVGFASRVGQRLMESKGRLEVATSSTALVVVKDQQVKDALAGFFPNLVNSKSHRVDFRGQMAGRANGDRADIGNTRVGNDFAALGAGR